MEGSNQPSTNCARMQSVEAGIYPGCLDVSLASGDKVADYPGGDGTQVNALAADATLPHGKPSP